MKIHTPAWALKHGASASDLSRLYKTQKKLFLKMKSLTAGYNEDHSNFFLPEEVKTIFTAMGMPGTTVSN